MFNLKKIILANNIYVSDLILEKLFISKIKKIKLIKNKYQNNNLEKENSKNLIELIKPITNHIFTVIQNELNFKRYEIFFSWIQKYNNNHYHNLHTHDLKKSDYSFILYVDCSKHSAPTIFYNVGYPYIQHDFVNIHPVIGRLVVFQGVIPHEVPPNTDNKRLIISGNIGFKHDESYKKFDTKKISRFNRK